MTTYVIELDAERTLYTMELRVLEEAIANLLDKLGIGWDSISVRNQK